MRTLILETSCEKSCLILSEEENPIAIHFLNGGPELSKGLAIEVKKLLDSHPARPDLVAVGMGPGSYTGIRVGASLGKALAFGWEVPLIGFCSLLSFAPRTEGPFAILVDARIGGLYALFGERQENSFQFGKPVLLQLDDDRLKRVQTIASPHPERIRKRVELPGIWIETEPDPQAISRSVYAQFHREEIGPLELNYLTCP